MLDLTNWVLVCTDSNRTTGSGSSLKAVPTLLLAQPTVAQILSLNLILTAEDRKVKERHVAAVLSRFLHMTVDVLINVILSVTADT